MYAWRHLGKELITYSCVSRKFLALWYWFSARKHDFFHYMRISNLPSHDVFASKASFTIHCCPSDLSAQNDDAKYGWIRIFTRGQFWPSGIVVACVCVCVCLSVCQSRVCPRDNSSPVQARITKFWAQMQNTSVKVPIVLWGDRPWTSRPNLTWKSNFTSF